MNVRGPLGMWLFPLLSLLCVPAALADSASDFVEPSTLDPTIRIELPYATANNFCKKKLYPVERCFLRRAVAEKLVEAHRSLAKDGLGLKIWDGYRPHSVQYLMWDASPSPGYVGHPKQGSKHNRGAAVDVTLVELKTGNECAMPTPYDEFSPRAHLNYFQVSEEIAANRTRLQTAMREAGFLPIDSEWWHFDYRDWAHFPLANFPIEDLAADSDTAQAKPDPAQEKPVLPTSPAPSTR